MFEKCIGYTNTVVSNDFIYLYMQRQILIKYNNIINNKVQFFQWIQVDTQWIQNRMITKIFFVSRDKIFLEYINNSFKNNQLSI